MLATPPDQEPQRKDRSRKWLCQEPFGQPWSIGLFEVNIIFLSQACKAGTLTHILGLLNAGEQNQTLASIGQGVKGLM